MCFVDPDLWDDTSRQRVNLKCSTQVLLLVSSAVSIAALFVEAFTTNSMILDQAVLIGMLRACRLVQIYSLLNGNYAANDT